MLRSWLIVFVLMHATAVAAEDWPGFLGPTGDGKSPESAILLDWPEAGPPLVWEAEAGEGYSAPSVAAGKLFMFDRVGDRARLRCLDAASGRQLWSRDYPTDYEDTYQFSNGPRTSPVVDGERVTTFGVEGRLRCHATADGKLLWEVDTRERFNVVQNFFGVGSTPVVEGDLLIAMVGGSPDSGIVAFDKRTGKVRYAVSDELASYASPVLATIGDRRWGFAFARGGLVAFEPSSGKIDFSFPWRAKKIESVNAANPVVVGNRLFLTESYGPGGVLLEIGVDGPSVVRKDTPGKGSLLSHWATPIHHDGYLYGCSGSGSGDAELRAVKLETGEIAWRKKGLGRSTLISAAGQLIVLGEYGELLLVRLTPEEYDERARVTLKKIAHPAWNAPVLADGLLYLRGKDRLLCLDLNVDEHAGKQ